MKIEHAFTYQYEIKHFGKMLEPKILPDFSRGRVRIKVGKTRFGDSLGIADVFTLDPDTWEVELDTSGY